MKCIKKLVIALKGLMTRLTESILNEIENIIKEEDSMEEPDYPIWYNKEYNEGKGGKMRWRFGI